jgi:hypothetical protein
MIATIQLPKSLEIRFKRDARQYAKGNASRILLLYSRVDIPDEERTDSQFNIFQHDPDIDFYYSPEIDCYGGGVDARGRGFTAYLIKERIEPVKHETVFVDDAEFDIQRPWPLKYLRLVEE